MAKRNPRYRCVAPERWRWREIKPKSAYEREQMLKSCGSQCFLLPQGTPARPGLPSFPICEPKSCCISCDALRAAYIRARVVPKGPWYKGRKREEVARLYGEVERKALSLAVQHGCAWVKTTLRKQRR